MSEWVYPYISIMAEERKPQDLLDVITFYPPRNQAAIYIALEYVNTGLGKAMVYDHFLPYEDDYYRMLECLTGNGSDEKLSIITSLLMMDLRTLTAPLQKCITQTGKIRKSTKYTPEYLMSYGIMLDALNRILKVFHTLPETSINHLLEDRTMEDGVLYFHEIEKISDGVIMEMMKGMMEFVRGE